MSVRSLRTCTDPLSFAVLIKDVNKERSEWHQHQSEKEKESDYLDD
jgi:hypothetical protein